MRRKNGPSSGPRWASSVIFIGPLLLIPLTSFVVQSESRTVLPT